MITKKEAEEERMVRNMAKKHYEAEVKKERPFAFKPQKSKDTSFLKRFI